IDRCRRPRRIAATPRHFVRRLQPDISTLDRRLVSSADPALCPKYRMVAPASTGPACEGSLAGSPDTRAAGCTAASILAVTALIVSYRDQRGNQADLCALVAQAAPRLAVTGVVSALRCHSGRRAEPKRGVAANGSEKLRK